MDRIDLYLNKEYIEFYKSHKQKQHNLTDLLDGNICRMCVCESKEELQQQSLNATRKILVLYDLQLKRLEKQEEILGETK